MSNNAHHNNAPRQTMNITIKADRDSQAYANEFAKIEFTELWKLKSYFGSTVSCVKGSKTIYHSQACESDDGRHIWVQIEVKGDDVKVKFNASKKTPELLRGMFY